MAPLCVYKTYLCYSTPYCLKTEPGPCFWQRFVHHKTDCTKLQILSWIYFSYLFSSLPGVYLELYIFGLKVCSFCALNWMQMDGCDDFWTMECTVLNVNLIACEIIHETPTMPVHLEQHNVLDQTFPTFYLLNTGQDFVLFILRQWWDNHWLIESVISTLEETAPFHIHHWESQS